MGTMLEVLKIGNPYHDNAGRFCTQDKATTNMPHRIPLHNLVGALMIGGVAVSEGRKEPPINPKIKPNNNLVWGVGVNKSASGYGIISLGREEEITKECDYKKKKKVVKKEKSGLSPKAAKALWNSVAGQEHPHAACVSKMTGKVSDPHAFCAAVEMEAAGTTPVQRVAMKKLDRVIKS